MVVAPDIAGYGNSLGVYNGKEITKYSLSGQINSYELNKSLDADEVKFNAFEQSVTDYVFARLGHPTIRVELSPFQVKTCIDEAITQLDYRAPMWSMQYAVFDASAGENVYELPLYILNNLNYVVYKKDMFGIANFPAGSFGFDLMLGFWNSNRFFSNMSMGDYVLTQQYMEIIRRVLSNEGGWDVVGGRFLQLNPTPNETPTPVIVEYRALDSDTIHPAYRNWIQRYTLACAKEILGRVRSKFQVIPGPGGGAQMDGQLLVQEGREEKEKLMEELMMQIEEPPFFITG